MNRDELKAKYSKPKVPHQWRKTDMVSAMVSTFFGSGMLPKMPGTWGSLAAAIAAYPLALAAVSLKNAISFQTSYGFFLLLGLITFFGAIPFVKKAMRDTETEDPGWIVIDEVCGIFMTFAFITVESILAHPWLLLVGFGLFRFFDILKPLGIHKFESFPGAWGVMADDLLGGIYAGLLLLALVAGIGL